MSYPHWTSVASPPTKSGEYRVKCGTSGHTFWACYQRKPKVWTVNGEVVVFGLAIRGDQWRILRRRA